jgi:hypothetical protein
VATTPRRSARAALVMGVLACTFGGLACASGAATRPLDAGIAHPTSLIAPDARVRGGTSKPSEDSLIGLVPATDLSMSWKAVASSGCAPACCTA